VFNWTLDPGERKSRQQQFGHSVNLFEMRIPGENECVDPERLVREQSVGHRVRTAHQCSPRSAANQAHPGPEIRADLELVSSSAMECGHSPLALRLELSKGPLRHRNGRVVETGNELVGRGPCGTVGFSHDDVDAQSESQNPSEFGGPGPHIGDLRSHRGGGLAPREIHVDSRS